MQFHIVQNSVNHVFKKQLNNADFSCDTMLTVNQLIFLDKRLEPEVMSLYM